MEPDQQILTLERQFKTAFAKLPLIVGNEAVNFTLDNFRRQGFQGNTFQPWKGRKNPNKWGKVKRPGRALLIDRGRLRRSVRITRITYEGVAIGTDVPYAKAHNEGVSGLGVIQTVKGFTRKNARLPARQGSEVKPHERKVNMKLPKRQFMGNSPYLDARIKRVAVAEIMKEIKAVRR